MKKPTLILLILALLIPNSGWTQENVIPIAAGSSSGTYKKFLDEIASVSGNALVFKEVESHGAVENLDLLVTNKVAMAFMHSDVPFFRAQREDLSKFKTLLALFTEEVHFLAPRASKRPPTKSGGVMGYGGTVTPPPVINSVEDLKGLKVGAAGGGAITAQVIRLQSNIPYEFVSFQKGDDVMAALNRGEIDAAVFVGGAPLPNIEKLGPEYKLLPFGSQTIAALKQVYKPATITYPKMNPEGVPTIGADALLMSREYKSPKMVNMLKTFRQTFFEHLLELQETPGIHPKWQEVSPENKGKWPYLEFTNSPTSAPK